MFCKPVLPGRAWPVPYMARRNHSGAANMGGPVPAEHINMFPTGLLPPSAYIRQTGPFCTHNSGNALTDAPHPVGAAAMPGPCRTGNFGDTPTDAQHLVGNTFMCSETRRFAPETGAFCELSLPGRAWPVPYMARRNGLDAFNIGGPVPAERINAFPTGPVLLSGYIRHASLLYKSHPYVSAEKSS